jgi:hypothetical protein
MERNDFTRDYKELDTLINRRLQKERNAFFFQIRKFCSILLITLRSTRYDFKTSFEFIN